MEGKVRQAVVMVGGKGTRLLPLTETRPKIILPVADRPCLWYLLRSLARAGIEEVILACGYKSEQMREAIGDGSDLGLSIIYSYEDEPLGTGGAMKLVEDRLDDVFVAANGDVFASIDVASEIREHIDSGASVTISLTPVDNPCEFGIARVQPDGRITEFKEKPKPEEVFSNLINAGVYVLNRSVLGYVPEKPHTGLPDQRDLDGRRQAPRSIGCKPRGSICRVRRCHLGCRRIRDQGAVLHGCGFQCCRFRSEGFRRPRRFIGLWFQTRPCPRDEELHNRRGHSGEHHTG